MKQLQINPNMERWIKASIGKHFTNLADPYQLFIDGQIKNTQSLQAWAEMKIIGLVQQRYSANELKYTCTIIIFTSAIINPDDQQLHYRIAGHFLSLLDGPILVYKLGKDKTIDDGSQIGCLVLRNDVGRPIDRLDYGNVENVQQSSLEGQYQMEQP